MEAKFALLAGSRRSGRGSGPGVLRAERDISGGARADANGVTTVLRVVRHVRSPTRKLELNLHTEYHHQSEIDHLRAAGSPRDS